MNNNGHFDNPPDWAAAPAFDDNPPPQDEPPPALMPDADGVKWADYTNAITRLGYTVRMNDLDGSVEINGNTLDDGMEAELLMKMHDKGFKSAQWVKRALTATAHNNRYNPIKDFLNDLVWDGKDWIAELERYVWDKNPKIIYADGSVRPVFGAWLKRWGIGAVGKVLKEGKIRGQNPMFVWAGGQDAGKSTLARALNPLPDKYHCEETIEPDKEEQKRWLSTKFVWEVAELGATTRKADREGLKNFLTKQDSNFRIPYAHHPVTKPATVSFIGTVNPEKGFLNDPTGHRRFLVMDLDRIDFDYVNKIDFTQLWAQFVALYRAGEPASLTPEEKAMADAIRGKHEIEDPFAGFVLKYYDIDPDNKEWMEQTSEIVDQLLINGVHNANVSVIGAALTQLGLVKDRITIKGQKVTIYRGIRRNDAGDQVRR
jgi:predicted P-loop ATPase